MVVCSEGFNMLGLDANGSDSTQESSSDEESDDK